MDAPERNVTPELHCKDDVCAVLRISKSTLHKLAATDPSFPPRLQITHGAARWRRAEIELAVPYFGINYLTNH